MNDNNGSYLLTIPGQLPGANDYIAAERANRHKAAKMKRDAQSYIAWYIKRDLRGVRIKRPVVLSYTWWEKDRRRDKDNIAFAKKFIRMPWCSRASFWMMAGVRSRASAMISKWIKPGLGIEVRIHEVEVNINHDGKRSEKYASERNTGRGRQARTGGGDR